MEPFSAPQCGSKEATSNIFRHPAILAKQAATVDCISGGRLNFGIGAGWNESEHRGYGVPFPPSSERVARLDEACTLIRRTWSTMQDAPQLLLHLEWWRAYYHFVRPHESLRQALAHPMDRGSKRQPQRYRQRTPAMAAGVTSRRWTVRDLLARPLPPELVGAA